MACWEKMACEKRAIEFFEGWVFGEQTLLNPSGIVKHRLDAARDLFFAFGAFAESTFDGFIGMFVYPGAIALRGQPFEHRQQQRSISRFYGLHHLAENGGNVRYVAGLIHALIPFAAKDCLGSRTLPGRTDRCE